MEYQASLNLFNSKLDNLEHLVRVHSIAAASELDAIHYLRSRLSPRGYIPPAGGWASSYATLAFIVGEILDSSTKTTPIEFGSGVSTVWTALALKSYGAGKLISIEHDIKYLNQTAELLARNRLAEYVDLRHAPLVSIDGFSWYDTKIVTRSLPQLDLVFVDGPPGKGGTLARKPAFDVLRQYLSEGALVLLDDCDRPDEREIIDRWTNDGPRDYELQYEGEVSRTALLRYSNRSAVMNRNDFKID